MKYDFLNLRRVLLFHVFLCMLSFGFNRSAMAQCPDVSSIQVDFSVVTCNGASDGTITLTVNDANGYMGDYSYSLFRNPETGIPPGLFTETTSDLTWTFTGLIPATYTIIITPEAPCANLFPGDVVLTQPEPLEATLQGITPACVPGTGGIDIEVTGGNGNYSYAWTGPTDPGNVEDPTSIDAGTYSVTVSDDKGCNVTIPDIFVPIITEANAGTDQTVCINSATLNGNPYRDPGETGLWTLISGSGAIADPTDPTTTVSNLGDGDNVFEWFITDDGSFCPGTTDQVTITWTNLQLISPGDILLECNGVANGAGTFTLIGGTAPFTFTIDSNTAGATTSATANSLNFSNAGVGNLSVTVKDNSNCSQSATIAITEPPAIVISSETKTDATCDGGSDGSVTIAAAGGTGALTFTLQPDGITNSTGFFDGLDAGSYTVEVMDDNSCGPVVSTALVVGAPDPILIDNTISTNVTCNGGNDGSITIESSGGTGQLTYTLQPAGVSNTSGVFAGLSAGSYTVEITDANSCGPISTPVITISEPTGVTFDSITSTDIICNGNNDGSITITVSGGTTPYSYTLLPNNITNSTGTFTGLTPGTYSVDVTEGSACGPVNSGDIIISEPPLLTIGAPTGTDVTCNGAADGTMSVSASGGTGTLTYTLQPGGVSNSTGTFNNITAGTYTIDVQDDNSCLVTSGSVTINEPAVISIDNISQTDANCAGGSDGTITITGSGGTGTLTYTLQPGSATNTTGTFSGLTSGTYTVDVTDDNNCGPVSTGSITIGEPSLDLPVSDAAICNPTTTDVTITVGGTTTGIEYELQTTGGASLSPAVTATGNGGNVDLVILQADVPAITTTYQVAMLLPGCGPQILTDQPVVTVTTGPSSALAVSDFNECEGSGNDANFIISSSEAGVTYELQNTDGSSLTPPVSVTGTGGDVGLVIAAADLPTVSTTYQVGASISSGCSAVLADQPVLTFNELPDATLGSDVSTCPGDDVVLTFTLTGTGPWDITYNDGTTDQTVTANASPFDITVAPITTTTYSLVSVQDQSTSCTNSSLTSSATVSVTPITGDQISYGSGVWIGYVYDDSKDPRGYPARADFDTNKYRGFINQPDNFDLDLGSGPLSGSDLCRDYSDDYSIRFRQTKTFTPGTYELTVGADDGFRLSLDGGATFVIDQFVTQSYTTQTINICLDGTYDMVLEYFERDGQSRVSYNSTLLAPAEDVSVTIMADQLPVCEGDGVTFTATPVNAGTTPSFQWQVNGTNLAGETDDTYVSSSLNNGDIVRVVVTADPSATCVNGSPATSNELTFNSTTTLTATVTISSDQNPACTGSDITFGAVPGDAGPSPTFQWQVNGVDVTGETNTFFVASGISDGDIVRVILTPDPSLTCISNATATSNEITASFVSSLTAAVNITADQDPVCDGSDVTYSAVVTDAGASPTYQWQVNGTNVAGEVTSIFTSSTLNNGDLVKVIVTADPAATCVNNSPVTSNVLTYTEAVSTMLSVAVAADQNPVCSGEDVQFTTTVTDAGASPTYQWQVNGTDITGETAATYVSNSLNNGDMVRVVVTADPSLSCVANSPLTSPPVTMTVTNSLEPEVTITADQNPVCTGDAVTFTATSEDGGAAPTYQWRINGTDVAGETGLTFSNPGIIDGDIVDVVMTVDPLADCATTGTAVSNAITVDIVTDLVSGATITVAQNPVCLGTSSVFTVATTNAGINPTYQWQVNGTDISGETGETFDYSLNDGDMVDVVVTADPLATCVSNSPVTSNNIEIETVTDLIADISITADQNPVCSGTDITFSATVTDAGTNPTLQWFVNGSEITGETASDFVTGSLNDGDMVTAVATADSTATCVSNSPVTSNPIEVTIATDLMATVSITADQNPVCTGDAVTFTEVSSGAGSDPTYQWRLNGTDVSGETSSTYTASGLNDGDLVSVVLTADPLATCVGNSPIESNAIPVNVVGSLDPAVTIIADQNPVCIGDDISWTANTTGAGANPTYQWQVNAVDVAGETGDTFTSNTLTDGDQVSVAIETDPLATCVTSTTAASAPETVNVVTSLVPAVAITASQTTLCSGQTVTFNASVTDGGANPSYQWQINGSPVVGATSASLTISTILDGDQVNVLVTADPSVSCAAPGSVSSNVIDMTVRPVGDPACAGGGENCGTFVVEVTPTRPPCNAPDAGALAFVISGGSGNYTLVLSNNASFNQGEAGLAGTTILFEDLTADDYQYTITDSNGTTCTLPFTLQNETILEAAVVDVTNSSCFNEAQGSATIEILSGGNPPYEYSLDGILWYQSTTSVFTVEDLSPENSPVGILIRDDFSDVCPEEVMVTIDNLYPEIEAVTSIVPVTTCDGMEGVLNVDFPPTGGNSPNGLWNISLETDTDPPGTLTPFTGSRSFTGLTAGEYSLYLEDEGGCQKRIPVTITSPNQVQLEAQVISADCSNDGRSGGLNLQVTNSLQVPGPYDLVITGINGAMAGEMIYADASWSGSLLQFDTLLSATYHIAVTPFDTNLCSVEVDRTIDGGPQPVYFDYSLMCAGGTSNKDLLLTDIQGNEGEEYTLQVYDNLTSALEEEITFTLNIGNQYLLSNYLFLTRNKEYKLRLIQKPAICGGGIEVRYDHPVNLLIPTSLTAQVGNSTKSLPDRPTGTLEVINFSGGFQPTDNAYPYLVAMQLDSAAVPGQSYSSDPDTVRLNTNLDFSILFEDLPAGRYRVIVMDQLGCSRELVGRVPLDTDLFIPNIFTPNGDSKNETFFIRNKPDTKVEVRITNRWGKQVYASTDYQNNWDGGDVADGVYYYLVDTGEDVYKGWVEILRGSRP